MKIYINKRRISISSLFVILIVILEVNCYNLINIPARINSLYFKTLIISLGIGYCYIIFGIKKLPKMSIYLKNYILITIILITIEMLYSMIVYYLPVQSVFLFGGHYFSILLCIPILKTIQGDDDLNNLLEKINIIVVVYITLLVIQAFIYNNFGYEFLVNYFIGFRYEKVRITMGSFRGLVLCYNFFMYLTSNKKRKFHLYAIVVILIGAFYMEMIRATEIAYFLVILIIYITAKKMSIKKSVVYLAIVCGVIWYIHVGYFDLFMQNLTGNSYYNTFDTRVDAIDYYKQFFFKNPILGIGIVAPENFMAFLSVYGIDAIGSLDDIGLLGFVFKFGMVGIILYIMLVGRMLFIILKCKKCREFPLLIGILTYSVSTSISLSIFDVQRIIALPFYLCIFEHVYMQLYVGKEAYWQYNRKYYENI